ncbi:MAG: lasso peptide [Coleofasciculus sp. S288]|nr:lasso peptide [Coleofasciculus sp. S288]
MKKTYIAPEMTTHGSVESITQAFGPSPVEDTIYAGQSNANQPGTSQPGTVIGTNTGSRDGIVVIH